MVTAPRGNGSPHEEAGNQSQFSLHPWDTIPERYVQVGVPLYWINETHLDLHSLMTAWTLMLIVMSLVADEQSSVGVLVSEQIFAYSYDL